MVDESKVAGPDAGTASRAMTAPAGGGFPAPAAGSPGALAHSPAGGAPAAKPAPAKRSGLRRFIVPVLILAALGYGGKTAYDYFVEGRFLVSTDDAYVGADTSIIAAKAMGHLTAVPVVDNQVVHKGDSAGRDRRRRLPERGRRGARAHRHPGRDHRPLRPADRRPGRDHRPGAGAGGERGGAGEERRGRRRAGRARI